MKVDLFTTAERVKCYLPVVKHKTKLLPSSSKPDICILYSKTGLNTNPVSFINPILYTFLNSPLKLLDYDLLASLTTEPQVYTKMYFMTS